MLLMTCVYSGENNSAEIEFQVVAEVALLYSWTLDRVSPKDNWNFTIYTKLSSLTRYNLQDNVILI